MAEQPRTAEERGQRIGETFNELSEQIAALVRQELERARSEATERAREAGKAGSYLALTAVFGLAAGGAALTLPVVVLRRALPGEATAIVVGGLYGAAAVAFGRRALERLQAAAPAAVEEKIEEKKDDLSDSLRERMPGTE
ncbi:MAG: phage holin family protein [Actinomycetota bacterium]|nr:phage holin family protein [Actinomycetota bacterium]